MVDAFVGIGGAEAGDGQERTARSPHTGGTLNDAVTLSAAQTAGTISLGAGTDVLTLANGTNSLTLGNDIETVTGGTGALGRQVVPQIIERGAAVRILSLNPPPTGDFPGG